jgi:poly(3-hydroxybutyrate) depolymerase
VLHGCTQTGQQHFETGGWRELADRYKFVALVPSQSLANNLT